MIIIIIVQLGHKLEQEMHLTYYNGCKACHMLTNKDRIKLLFSVNATTTIIVEYIIYRLTY